MRCLPPLVVGACRWVLPLADASSAVLAELLLNGDEGSASHRATAALAADPPLLLWTVCIAQQRDGLGPEDVAEVLQWLAQNAGKVLHWNAPDDDISPLPFRDRQGVTSGSPLPLRERQRVKNESPLPLGEGQQFDSPLPLGEGQGVRAANSATAADVFGDLVFSAIYTADLSAQLARGQGPQAVARAQLLGLLHNARQWLMLAAGNSQADDATCCLPTWLAEVEEEPTPAAAAVRLAARIIAGDASLPEQSAVDVEACRRRAVEGRERWLMPIGGAVDWLPILATKLARLGELEQNFHKALETEKLAAMAEFAAGAGHEINNPLTVIAGRAQLLLQQETDPERRRGLALVSVQAMRAYEMIADMRLFARPPQPEFQKVDLVTLVDKLISDFVPRAARQETSITRDGHAGPLEIDADPTQLTVALNALCQNALDAIGHGGQIRIAVQQSGTDVEISVADDGPGILPEERRHLFDPFYSARQAGRGLGMGLSKCWRIITNHGGRIDVDSQPGHGATFTITLPMLRS